ncbi:MAG: tyrosine-type recombinase/integrase [Firmicutes bacterium]|nr:tyrosine-type recombinase/integrase [Bacillota bacterium]
MTKNQTIQRFATVELANGQKKRIAARGKTEREALQKLAKLQAEYAAGIRTANGNTKLRLWYEQWLEIYKLPSITIASADNIRIAFRKYFLPLLGEMPISKIKPLHIKQAVNQFQGLSKSYAKKNFAFLKECFDAARANGLIISNPCADVKLPTVKPAEERRALTEQEQKLFLTAIKQHNYGLLFGISYACGLRPGEARALRWSDIDFKQKLVHITHAVENKTDNLKAPKTAAGIRTVTIPNWYLAELAKRPIPINRDAFIFGNGRTPINERLYKRSWHSLMRTMDILNGATLYRNQIIKSTLDNRLSPYYLRHTYATKLAEHNIPLKEAQRLLGHTKPEMTLRFYQHCTEKMQEETKSVLRDII